MKKSPLLNTLKISAVAVFFSTWALLRCGSAPVTDLDLSKVNANKQAIRLAQMCSFSAGRVIGQSGLSDSGANGNSGCSEIGCAAAASANRLSFNEAKMFIDVYGNLWVADQENHRILHYTKPFTTNMSADLVIGQADFTSKSMNRGGSAARNTLANPSDMVMDGSGNLWVADKGNNRVLRYDTPFSNGMDASIVLGQSDWTGFGNNRSGATCRTCPVQNGFSYPQALTIDGSGNLYIAERENHRVVRYDDPIDTSGPVPGASDTADVLLGQANWTSGSANRGGSTAANSFSDPRALHMVSNYYLWVVDNDNNRLVGYIPSYWDASGSPSGVNAVPELVYGQANFTSGSPNRGGSVSDDGLNQPTAVRSDYAANLVIADKGNHRVVLVDYNELASSYASPHGSDVVAKKVYGQSDFTSNSAYMGSSVNDYSFDSPSGVAATVQTDDTVVLLVSEGTADRITLWDLENAYGASLQTKNCVAVGAAHTCAIRGGALYCWGYNSYGQLGLGDYTDRSTPTLVTGLEKNVRAVAAGVYHTCAVKDGGLKCFGYGGYGSLGTGDSGIRIVPTDVYSLGAGSGVTHVAINSAGYHTCAIVNGNVQCFGYNASGQLGDGTATDRFAPVSVASVSGATLLTLGHSHSCALDGGGTLKCWGNNSYGQIGNNTFTSNYYYATDSNVSGTIKAVGSGNYHTCAVTTISYDDYLYCWGANESGQVGDTTNTTPRRSPQLTVLSGFYASWQNVRGIAGGSNHTCAYHATVAPKCWGHNGFGQLGDGTTTYRNRPADPSPSIPTSYPIAIGAGEASTCLATPANLYCWGYNGTGQLGDGTTTTRYVPTSVSGW